MSNTGEQARKRLYFGDPRKITWFGDSPTDPYEYFNSITHKIKRDSDEKAFIDFKKARPMAAEFLQLAFGDMAKNVFQYFPPDISEAKCILLAANLSQPKDLDESRAINSLDSHIEEL